jgi:hypothetical protein
MDDGDFEDLLVDFFENIDDLSSVDWPGVLFLIIIFLILFGVYFYANE